MNVLQIKRFKIVSLGEVEQVGDNDDSLDDVDSIISTSRDWERLGQILERHSWESWTIKNLHAYAF